MSHLFHDWVKLNGHRHKFCCACFSVESVIMVLFSETNKYRKRGFICVFLCRLFAFFVNVFVFVDGLHVVVSIFN